MTTLTKEQVDKLVGRYTSAVAEGLAYAERTALVEEMANETNVTKNVVIGVLVAEGVYVRKEKENTITEGTKNDYADAFRAVTGKKMTSLENLTKKDLIDLWNWHVEVWAADKADAKYE